MTAICHEKLVESFIYSRDFNTHLGLKKFYIKIIFFFNFCIYIIKTLLITKSS